MKLTRVVVDRGAHPQPQPEPKRTLQVVLNVSVRLTPGMLSEVLQKALEDAGIEVHSVSSTEVE